MITDDVFDFGQSYYCVPNVNRVAEMDKPGSTTKSRIWISPIIIPCSIFLPDINTEIEALDSPEDFESAIELIYESDSYMYGELFGSLENAKRVFPELLRTKNCKFYKDNYLIIKEDDEVVGVAAMYKSEQCVWDTDVILKAFGNAGVNPPSSFNNAVEHMQDVFNDALGNSFYMLDDICVKSTHRNRGIGRSLINYIIKEAERDGASLILSTYADNRHAYNIYTYLGFIPYSKNTSGTSGGKDYFRMIKI
jgi:ribosomal protein S18 acetylase RimI-like enzyme